MHTIHTTPGFIIDSRPRGEAGKLMSLFTRDFGLVLARAEGIRLEKSKLRYHTQDHSFGDFSLVRGREFWRLTSAQSFPIRREGEGHELLARLASLLRRLLHGEEANPELFDRLRSSQLFVAENAGLDAERLKTLESLIVIRVLDKLGYIGDVAELNDTVRSAELNVGLLDRLGGKRVSMNKHINKALKESHL